MRRGDPVDRALVGPAAAMAAALLLIGCASLGDTAVEPLATVYVEEIEQMIANGEALNAVQRISALETAGDAAIERVALEDLKDRALISLAADLQAAVAAERYLEAVALRASLEVAGGSVPVSLSTVSTAELFRREIARLAAAGEQVSALMLGLRVMQQPGYQLADYQQLLALADGLGNRRAQSLIHTAASARGFPVQEPEVAPVPPFSTMLNGMVTVWVDRGIAIRGGVGVPDRVIGSGFFIDRRGFLLTNYHVIKSEVDTDYEGYSRLFVRLSSHEDEKLPAKVIGYDRIFDLALLKAEVEPEFVFASAGGTELAPGDPVVAIGSPGGLSKTVTSGIVSATGRRFLQIGDSLQVDAPLNPGNSGGPLLNQRGELVGITFAGLEQFEGINFGISYSWIQDLLPKLFGGGEISHLWLGVAVVRRPAGLEVTYIVPGSPAAAAGIVAGDLILQIGDHQVNEIVEAQRHLLRVDAPTLTAVRLRRAGTELELVASLRTRPFLPLEVALERDARDHVLVPLFGMRVEQIGRYFFRPEYRVSYIVPGSIADETGISVSDPLRIDGFRVEREERIALLRVLVKKRKAGFLESVLLLAAPLEQNSFL